MVKHVILIAALILALVRATSPSLNNYSNYNADVQDNLDYLDEHHIEKFRRDVGPDHGATYLFFDGFYYGLQIYNNVTHRNECRAFIPDAHDDLVDIYYKFKNATSDSDCIELIRYALGKIDHILQRINDTRDDCRIYQSEMKEANRQVRQYLHDQEDYYRKIADHILHNLGIITQKTENYKDDINNKEWRKAGFDMGDLIHFLTLWDYPPQNTTKISSSFTPILNKINLRYP
jgi:hypothetical protein